MLYYYGIMRAGWGAGVGCILAEAGECPKLFLSETNVRCDKRASLPGRRMLDKMPLRKFTLAGHQENYR